MFTGNFINTDNELLSKSYSRWYHEQGYDASNRCAYRDGDDKQWYHCPCSDSSHTYGAVFEYPALDSQFNTRGKIFLIIVHFVRVFATNKCVHSTGDGVLVANSNCVNC